MSQTLFLKDKTLYIRINDGEYEVNNPEIVGKFGVRILSESFILRYPLFTKDGYILLDGNDEAEWPYGVELNWRIAISTARDTKYTSCTEEYAKSNPGFHSYAVARLLPKEEKKEMTNKEEQELLIVNEAINKHRWESDYKEPQDKEQLIGLIIDDFKNGKEIFVPSVESSEPQENIFDLPKDVVFDLQRIALADDEMSAGFGAGVEYRLIARSILNKHRKPVSAPSESQEEMWNEVNEHINAQIGDYISLEAVKLSFILTRKPE